MLVLLFICTIADAASPADCAKCHRPQTTAFAKSGMTLALQKGSQSPILKANQKLTTKRGGYSYEISDSIYSVSDGKQTLKIPIEWAFGQGTTGQTFLFQKDGRWYESMVSYYAALRGLDVTIGAQNITPHNLLEAAGRVTTAVEATSCFDCHATNVAKGPNLAAMREGVQCERCHGASETHLRSNAPMKKLGAMNTEQMSDFCGQCHRTWAQIAVDGPRGILNVRFQPYRLGNSKCYDTEDTRISCTTCHDPHRELQTSTASYDVKCLACHSKSAKATKASAHICRVAKKDCVTCHMPRLDLPGAHKQFTDHRIRIAKANEPYPD